ncbi:hydantoinase/oxoprolinase family protein [Paenalcaligenes niemegkensis]|uniref:hydantoinase/oxoprolinase family protein n=1 Tax=Paenalcaligenes niemegkensis TaxID=2895469 RepID=UPI001EE793E1|nr:hydantoinase/oxoprolinase family protein [Paenalcaligenes niemegkensis]MCQ9617692.1 hydantoinase/oxoprolinase family protein [Paenalcaligenes niemegkensis]
MSLDKKLVRVGVDIGGTFTDVALEVGAALFTTKVLTDYSAPERAILAGLNQILEQAGCTFGDIDVIIHGTTLATNALIERRGVPTALITTEGFRDVIEMRTENRFEQYDLNIVLPPALIDREHRYVLRERMDAHGKTLIAPSPEDIETLISEIEKKGYESVAIGFLHSYANGKHEQQVRDALQARLPQLSVSISSEVSPQIREYERFNTVCANAYVKPLIKSYLSRLVQELKGQGAVCDVFMMHSGGGIISVETAAEFPVRLVESGPAGGAIFAAYIAERYGLESVLSFDMGGTTAKVCLIENYAPKTAKIFEVARTYRFKKGSGMPISIPVVEMVEIGAGGGSIASVDGMNQIRVGPRSAGSEPGPACYQRGGESPTVTDANVVLGKLDPDYFAGGQMKLDAELAKRAIKKDIADPLGLSETSAAYGIVEVVDENMANAGRVHAVESGYDLGGFTMITFGGAGPVHAARLCEKMAIDAFLVPYGAGVGSALGFLRAPFGFESARSGFMKLTVFAADKVNQLLASMEQEATSFARQGLKNVDPVLERVAYMRYAGQGWEIPVQVPVRDFAQEDSAFLKNEFEKAYVRFFGRAIDGLDVEIVSWSVRASSSPAEVKKIKKVEQTQLAVSEGSRLVFESKLEKFVESGIYNRDRLNVGDQVTGPAIIVERETATMIPSTFIATVQTDLCLFVEIDKQAK